MNAFPFRASSALLLLALLLGCVSKEIHDTEAAPALRLSPEPEIRLCSQNINNYRYQRPDDRRRRNFDKQEEALVKRFMRARCDVIAVQEVGGASQGEARQRLSQLAKALHQMSGRSFDALVGDSMDEHIRNGFLVATDSVRVESSTSFAGQNLPKLRWNAPSRRFSRGPLLIRIRVPGNGPAGERQLSLFSIHLKSKANGWKDPTHSKFESFRMEMAEGIRELAAEEFRAGPSSRIVVVLGDINSDHHSATAAILAGQRTLEDFRAAGGCRLSSLLTPECPEEVASSATRPVLVPLLGEIARREDGLRRSASYRFRGRLEVIDEVFVHHAADWTARDDASGSPVAGVVGSFGKGSDHKLVWTELNW
ncbi:MAG: hypothetical protein KDD44_02515 [Bdellovibrionales bacterium]|nr:hypothetical protein [Bdellovibrionales bacterium]